VTAGVTAIRERLLASRSVAALLGDLRASWSSRAVIHGDVKFDNVLVGAADGRAGGDGPAARVWLIDWELAGLGEPGWDLAGCVEGVVTAQLMTAGRVDVPSAASLALPALEAHERVGGLTASLAAPAVILRWTAARLAQTSLQLAAMAGQDAAAADRARDLADLAISFAEEPRAWGAIVGIPVAATA
jgi:thiamine kinase-like enzyme